MKTLYKLIKVALIGASLMTMASCVGNESAFQGGKSRFSHDKSTRGSAHGQADQSSWQRALNQPSPERRILGTDQFLGKNHRNAPLVDVSDVGEYTLNLVGVPLEQAAKAVLGDALQKNYTIKPGVTGEVTLQTTRALTERALLETFQTVLEVNGATLQFGNDLITIAPREGAAQRVGLIGQQQGIGSRVVAVPLEYIGTAEMVRLLEPIAGQTISLQAIPKRNIILISGAKDEINAVIEAVNLFDVDVLKGKSVGLYKLKAAEPEAVVEELNLIFETEEGGSLQNVVSFVPSKRLSAIIVVTTRSKYLAKAERWIRDLDRTAGGNKRRPVVYQLQHRAAEELETILTEVQQDIADSEGPSEGAPKIVADNAKNALVVWGNDVEQESFSRLIQTLDTVPVQVLLEATIAEVSLNDELNFGLRWFFERGDFRGTFSDASNGGVGSTFPGLSFVFQGNSAGVALNALASVTDVQVVSSPSLLVLDNQEARLQIGDEVPIATQQVRDTANPNAPVVNTISFRDTGIILSVKPRVSRSGQVVLEIEQEVSSVSNTTTSGIDSPTISQRKIKTNVVVTDGNTIALGGLIEESKNRTNSKVPGAGDVPVLGALFRSRKDVAAKTELLVLITPRVIRDGQEARAIANELRQQLQGANGLINTGVVVPGPIHRIVN